VSTMLTEPSSAGRCLYLFFAVSILIATAAAQTWPPPGNLTYTSSTSTTTASGCSVSTTGYDWTFEDPSGGAHPFPGSSAMTIRVGVGSCKGGSSTTLSTWSTDGLYYLQATGGIGAITQESSTLFPKYKVTSIVYAPPGNKSSAGYAATTTNGTTTTLGQSFTNSNTITFSEGISAFGTGGSASQSFGTSVTTSNGSAFTETFTDATGVTNQSNSSSPNAINHGQDLFLIWLNPQIVVVGGPAPVSYSVGVQGSVLPDIVPIFASTMQANASGMTTVPATWLNPQSDPVTGVQTPGLASICANFNNAEYLASACTLADQCGCTPQDFAQFWHWTHY
jgi:hypothetical protein